MDYAVLIPTKGRPGPLTRLFKRCPALNRESTFVGIEPAERKLYTLWHRTYPKVQIVDVVNPWGVPSAARECLKNAVLPLGYARYVSVDDEHSFTEESLENLVRASREYERLFGPCFMAGLHGVHKFHHADVMAVAEPLGTTGLTTFKTVSTIYWCFPDEFYRRYTYPDNIHCDDIHAALSAMKMGYYHFRVCVEAPFGGPARQPVGGSGNFASRVRKVGQSMIQLAEDFPDWMTQDFVSLRLPYNRILESVELRHRQKEFARAHKRS